MVLNVLCLNLKLVILREKSHLHLVNFNGFSTKVVTYWISKIITRQLTKINIGNEGLIINFIINKTAGLQNLLSTISYYKFTIILLRNLFLLRKWLLLGSLGIGLVKLPFTTLLRRHPECVAGLVVANKQ